MGRVLINTYGQFFPLVKSSPVKLEGWSLAHALPEIHKEQCYLFNLLPTLHKIMNECT